MPAPIGLRLYYSVGWLARAAGVERHLMHRLLRSRGVTPERWGRTSRVTLSQLRERMPDLWRGLLRGAIERASGAGDRTKADGDRTKDDGDRTKFDGRKMPAGAPETPVAARGAPAAGREGPVACRETSNDEALSKGDSEERSFDRRDREKRDGAAPGDDLLLSGSHDYGPEPDPRRTDDGDRPSRPRRATMDDGTTRFEFDRRYPDADENQSDGGERAPGGRRERFDGDEEPPFVGRRRSWRRRPPWAAGRRRSGDDRN